MKRILFFTCLLLVAVGSRAQNTAVDKLFEKYSGQEGITSVYISSKMFQMFSEMEVGDPEYQEAIKGLKTIRILTTSDDYKGGADFYREIMKDLPVNQYEELMVVQEKDQNIKFLIREKDGKVAELLLVVGGKADNALISILGDIDMKSIAKLSGSLKIEGLENLQKIEEKEKK